MKREEELLKEAVKALDALLGCVQGYNAVWGMDEEDAVAIAIATEVKRKIENNAKDIR